MFKAYVKGKKDKIKDIIKKKHSSSEEERGEIHLNCWVFAH